MNKPTSRFIVPILFLLGLALPASALDLRPYASISYLHWEETSGGETFVEEDGPLYGAGVMARGELSPTLTLDARLELFGGIVDYEGAIFDLEGNRRPYDGETGYLGFSGEALLLVDLAPGAGVQSLRPAAGIGFHRWNRELDRDGPYGYDEIWTTIYLKAGAEWIRYNDYADWYAHGFLILPISNDEKVENLNLPGVDTISLEPGTETGLSLAFGRRNARWDMALTLEYLSFGESDPDATGQFFQPDSTWLRIGARAGLAF